MKVLPFKILIEATEIRARYDLNNLLRIMHEYEIKEPEKAKKIYKEINLLKSRYNNFIKTINIIGY